MKFGNIIKFTFGICLLSLTACSSGEKWINSLDLDTSDQNGDQYVQLSADVDTRALLVSSVSLPIPNPKNPSEIIGQVSLIGGLGTGSSKLSVLVKSSAFLDGAIAPGKGLMPNGTLIPVAVNNSNKWIEIAAGGACKVYFHLDGTAKKAVLGAAINLDDLKTGIATNVLVPFDKNNFQGVAGVYTGPTKGQSGFALFVDASSLLQSRVSGLTPNIAPVSKKVVKQVRDRILELEQKRILLRAH